MMHHFDLKIIIVSFLIFILSQGPQPVPGQIKYRTTIGAMALVAREEGFAALYKGLLPKVLRLGQLSIFCALFSFLIHKNDILYITMRKLYTKLPLCVQRCKICVKRQIFCYFCVRNVIFLCEILCINCLFYVQNLIFTYEIF